MDRKIFNRVFLAFEHYSYIVVGILLIFTIGIIFFSSMGDIYHAFQDGDLIHGALTMVDRMLLVIMAIEILYTVRVSLQANGLNAEPFLVVGLIASIRRILLISVDGAYNLEKFRNHMIEIGVLGVLIFIFVISIIKLRREKRIDYCNIPNEQN